MQTILSVLDRVASQLADDAARAGFDLADAADSVRSFDSNLKSGCDHGGMRLLGYRRSAPGAPMWLLDFCHIPAQHLITGALWRPDDVTHADRRASVEAMARCYRAWHYDDTATADTVASAIVAQARTWLACLERAGHAPGDPPAGQTQPCPSSACTARGG